MNILGMIGTGFAGMAGAMASYAAKDIVNKAWKKKVMDRKKEEDIQEETDEKEEEEG